MTGFRLGRSANQAISTVSSYIFYSKILLKLKRMCNCLFEFRKTFDTIENS